MHDKIISETLEISKIQNESAALLELQQYFLYEKISILKLAKNE